MTHWLDEQAAGLAEEGLSRRSVLLRGGALAAGAVLGRFGGPQSALAANPSGSLKRSSSLKPQGPCAITADPSARVTNRAAQTTFRRKSLTLNTQVRRDLVHGRIEIKERVA